MAWLGHNNFITDNISFIATFIPKTELEIQTSNDSADNFRTSQHIAI